jgi:CheY-specific phosphatase CheX
VIEIIGWDTYGGNWNVVIGIYDSIQVTGNLVRDEDGDTILTLRNDMWFDENYNAFYDWTAEIVK